MGGYRYLSRKDRPMTQEIERVDPMAALLQQSLYDSMDANQLAMLKATRMSKLSDTEIGVALELCRTLGLNPWNDEVYATKGNQGELLIMVGRNGLLRKAEEFPDYRGYDAGVVYENDSFAKQEPDPSAQTLRGRAGVLHHQGHPAHRGRVVGAWAVAEREGRPPRYFFAPLEDYMPENPHAKSAWARFPTVMIEKVPISVVHRTLTNLSGVYLREEVDKMLARPDGEQVIITKEEEWAAIRDIVGDLEVEEEVQTRLLTAMAEANELSPASWGLAKVQMTLPGRGPEELAAQAAQIEADVEVLRSREAARTDAAATAEEITDAVVVEDPADPAPRAAVEARLEEAEIELQAALDAEDAAGEAEARATISGLLDDLDALAVS